MASASERLWGHACLRCGAKTDLLVVVKWFPPPEPGSFYNPDGKRGWGGHARALCFDRAACDRRQDRQREVRSRRSGRLVLKEPAAPDAPRGTCRWCGEQLTGERSAARNYCYLEREGRDCRGESNNSWCWTGRELIQRRGDPVCVDCGSDDPHWEADHDVPLEDGGVHEPGNLVRRCVPCHRRKTGAENRERARRRRRANALTLAPRRTTA